jgi:short-subunit dehydrogenase
MIFNNKLKIAIVTGGTKGVGKELAKMFKKNNYNVIITGRQESNAINIADELNSIDRYSKGIVKGYKLDFTDIINSKKILNKLDNKEIKPTFLINNAGTLNTKNIDNITLKNFDNLLKVNTIGPMLLSKYCIDIIRNKTDHYTGILFNTPPYTIDDKTSYLLPYMQSKLAQTTLMKSLSKLSINNNALVCGFWTKYPLLTDAIIERKIGKEHNCMHPSILAKTLEELLFNTNNPTYFNSKVIIDEDFLTERNISTNEFKMGNKIKKLDTLFFDHLKNTKNIKNKKDLFNLK